MFTSRSVLALRRGLYFSVLASLPWMGQAGELATPSSATAPKVAPASNEGEIAIRAFKITPGLKAELFAAEPLFAQPVAFTIDEKGRFYVAETFRHTDGVLDIRGRMHWLDEELASTSTEQWLGYMQKYLKGKDWENMSKESERISLLEDTDGDGKADKSTVFSTGYNTPLSGIGAGLLARKGNVYYTCVPDLWLLQDQDGDGKAEVKKSISTGYGVRVAFLGHDLHGLRIGPDGKLYFSMGDRGYNVKTTEGKTLFGPEMGAVFRCNQDGSDMEVYAFGLRNPQELAFDQYGNLFTGDNNSDGGDQARWVYLVEGGDSGWHVGWQHITYPNARGPWNSEKMWHPQWSGQAAYIIPAITNLAAGPSGLTYYPGVGLPDRFNEHFFLCDFRGSPQSLVHSFAVKNKGAGFEVTDHQNLISGLEVTDVEFGPDGSLYVSDWVSGWGKTGKGRIYRLSDTNSAPNPLAAETKKIIGEGMDKRSVAELAKLLSHRDQRVRQEAQFALADKGKASIKTFRTVLDQKDQQLARLHAIWGLGQIGAQDKKDKSALDPLVPLLKDADAEVRAQAAKVLGDGRYAKAFAGLTAQLKDSTNPRGQHFAAVALGKLGRKESVPALIELLRANADKDPYLRHAAVFGLVSIGDQPSILAAAKDKDASVRMGALVALRRLKNPAIAQFLQDSNPALVLEAARAISDLPITEALPQLAALLGQSDLASQPLQRRAMNANYRLGQATNAATMARFAANISAPAATRAETLHLLGSWAKPSGRDAVTGLWRPVPERSGDQAAAALRPALANLLQNGPNEVREEAAQLALTYGVKEVAPVLLSAVSDTLAPAKVRVLAIKALAAQNDAGLTALLPKLAADTTEAVRKEASSLQLKLTPNNAGSQLATTLESGSVGDQQNALTELGKLASAEGDALLEKWMDKLLAGSLPPQLKLELLESAAKRPALKSKLHQFESSLPQNNLLATFQDCLAGGNPAEGRKIFLEKVEASCVRCHKISAEGGEVGPDLTGLGTRKTRDYILESIIQPNAQIAQGFENLVVTLTDGTSYAGQLKSENDQELVINSPEDGVLKLAKTKIAKRDRGLSGMPEGMDTVLSKRDLRDLVEFLASQK